MPARNFWVSVAPDATAGRVNRLLKMAVIGGVEAAVILHIERGDDLNARDERGFTPLMLAAAKNRSGVCRLLIDAGADAAAVNSTGQDARAIAVLMGAAESMAEIDLASARRAERLAAGLLLAAEPPVSAASELVADDARPEEPFDIDPGVVQVAPSAPDSSPPATFVVGMVADQAAVEAGDFSSHGDDGLPFDLSAWEAEEEAPPPVADSALFEPPTALQSSISVHEAIDDSEDWSDLDAFLPDRAAAFPRLEDPETSARLRALLLRALREGSVPAMRIADLYDGGAEADAAESLARLHVVLEDLGAETDERFEFRSEGESFEVFAAPETAEEEEEIDDAVAFFEDLEARRNDPMRLYMREAQRHGLIDAQREVALAKEMESAADRAVRCLASWTEGQRALLAAIDHATSENRPLSAITTGAPSRDASESELGGGFGGAGTLGMATEFSEIDESEPQATASADVDEIGASDELVGDTRFTHLVGQLRAVGDGATGGAFVLQVLREMSLTRAFLLQVGGVASNDSSAPAIAYRSAVAALSSARERMVAANTKLVLSIARRYMGSGVAIDDLIQEGNIGLLKAIDKFDWRRGFKFSTMAIWWIRQAISRSVADSAFAIRLPVHCREDVLLIIREARSMGISFNEHPSPGQIASRIGMKPSKVASLMRAMSNPLSIEQLAAEWEERGEDAADPFADLDVKQMQERLGAVLDRLEERQAEVMRLRAGIGTDDPRTLEEVGQRYGLTRERIRQIEAKAIKRMLHPTQRVEFDPWFAKEAKRGPAHRDHPRLTPTPPSDHPHVGSFVADSSSSGDAVEPTKSGHQEERCDTAALDDLLDQARAMGLEVVDARLGISQATWVHMDEPADESLRELTQGLVSAGFQHWPGRGYWL